MIAPHSVGVKLPTPGSDAPQIESPKARQGLADQQWYQCMSATSFAGMSYGLEAQQLQVATASSHDMTNQWKAR